MPGTLEPLRIGFHAPATGAAPVPIDEFEGTLEIYWRWQTEVKGRRIVGRDRVIPTFRDDKYNPSTAVQVCRELAAESFLIYGGAGTDQIQACARYLNEHEVPYLSGGVTEIGLAELPWYFAASMTYPAQMELLAQLIAARFPGRRAGLVAMDTANFDDAVHAWERALRRHGIEPHRTLRHPKGDETWYELYAMDLRDHGVEVALLLTDSMSYLRFAKAAHTQGYTPQYVGVGIGHGFDRIAYVTCPAADGALHLSPFPAMDQADAFDPEFRQALRHFEADEDDINDFSWVVWAASRLLHAMFDRYEQVHGVTLERGRFRELLETAGVIDGGIFPPVTFGPGQHFGGSSMHLLRVECGEVGGRHVTDTTYASAF